MKHISTFILILILVNTLPAQRNIHWVPGLGEKTSHMQYYRDFVKDEGYKNVFQDAYDYDEEVGISAAASALNNVLPENNNTIAIGHSLGGLVLREANRQNPNKIGGIITVGSPNRGAPILDAVRKGKVHQVANSSCDVLTKPPILTSVAALSLFPKLQTPKLDKTLSLFTKIEFASITLQDFVCDNFSLFFGGQLPNTFAGPERDMHPTSDFLHQLNISKASKPIVSIVGEESNNEHWRLLSTLATQNISKKESGNDSKYVKRANSLRSVYNIGFYSNLAAAIGTAIGGFFKPYLWFSSQRFLVASFAWKAGVNWFDRSETVWENLIGTRDVLIEKTVTFTAPSTNCNLSGFTGSSAWISCIRNCSSNGSNCPIQTVTQTYTVRKDLPNDGLLSTHHQSLPGQSEVDIFRGRGISTTSNNSMAAAPLSNGLV